MTQLNLPYEWSDSPPNTNLIKATEVNANFERIRQVLEDTGLTDENIAAAAAIAGSKVLAVPSGLLAPYVGSSAPTGWLLCDGTAVSRTTYAALFAIIGTAYGVGDGSTTFNLPDLRGRVPVGKGTHADVDTLGESDGVSEASRTPKTTLSTGQMPSHSHSMTAASRVIPSTPTPMGVINVAAGGAGYAPLVPSGLLYSDGPNTATSGGGSSHNHGFQVANYIVKT